jgi:hypothetical protein
MATATTEALRPLSRLSNFSSGGVFTTGVVLLLAFAQVGLCQTNSVQHSEPASSDVLEEIIVYGEKSLTRLRRERYRAEENFFDLFNSLNSNNEYNVECDYVVFLGDRRRHHLCQPEFARKYEADAAAAVMMDRKSGGGFSGIGWTTDRFRAVTKRKEELMWHEIAALLAERPELHKALADVAKAKRIYESERQRRCEGPRLFCRN